MLRRNPRQRLESWTSASISPDPSTAHGTTVSRVMAIPDVLALDFDGVLYDGIREYFETSRRTYAQTWPDEPIPGDEFFAAFRRLRPVILSGWEMPLLLRAIASGRADEEILDHWEAVRDDVAVAGLRHGAAPNAMLTTTLDQVRREWITADRSGWLKEDTPYCPLEEVRRLVAEPEWAVLAPPRRGSPRASSWTPGACAWPMSRARKPESTNVKICARGSRRTPPFTAAGRACGSSRTGSRPWSVSPSIPISATWASSSRPGATTLPRRGPLPEERAGCGSSS
jgi:hypothetical protein